MQRRTLSFIFCVFSGLFCGTNYVISAWAPQLSQRCHLSALAINLVGICGNLGVYLVSPLSGKLVDRVGPRLPLVLSAISLFVGYFGLHTAFEAAWEHSAPLLCFFSFLTGVGSSLGNSAVLNACAKSYPHNRGTATAFPIATYGLSAFVFSRISYALFPGRTGSFLMVLAVSCGSALSLSSYFVGVFELAKNHEDPERDQRDVRDSLEISACEETGSLIPSARLSSTDEDTLRKAEVIAEVTGMDLLRNRDFVLMIITLALLSGSGLMYINNLGNNLTALFRAENLLDTFPQVSLEKLQALNVSLLSIFNCTGRIFAGLTSDHLKHRYRLQRSAFLLFSSFIFVVGLLAIYLNRSSAHLAGYTSLLGFTYGNMFGIAPVLCSELFGLQNFSSNWGLMSVAPGISGNIFNLLYGRIYDQHSDPTTHICVEGLECYQDAFVYAILGALIASCSAAALYHHHRLEARRLAIDSLH